MRCDWYGCWRDATVYVDVLAYCSPHVLSGFGTWPARRFIEMSRPDLSSESGVMGSGIEQFDGIRLIHPRPVGPSSVPDPASSENDLDADPDGVGRYMSLAAIERWEVGR